MNEPIVVESVTNECQSLGRAHESSSARAEQLIACLEGEIAKRDEELAACRVVVENCEVFRARIAELEHRCGMYGLELTNEVERRLQAERQLAAIKAQEPVAAVKRGPLDSDGWPEFVRVETIGDFDLENLPSGMKLYAAPVSEAKAQGVVMPGRDSFMAGVKAASDKVKAIVEDYDQRHGSTDPDTGTREYPGNGDEWVCCMLELIEDFTGIVAPSSLNAAPAAPAADAGIVEALEIAVDYLNSNALSSIASGSTCHRKMRAALAARRSTGVV